MSSLYPCVFLSLFLFFTFLSCFQRAVLFPLDLFPLLSDPFPKLFNGSKSRFAPDLQYISLPFSDIEPGINFFNDRHIAMVFVLIKPPSAGTSWAEIRNTDYASTTAEQWGLSEEGQKCVHLFKAVAAVMHELKFCFNELWIFPLCLGEEKVSTHNYSAL